MNYLKVNLVLHQLNIVWRFLGRAVTGDKNKNTTVYSGHCDCDGDSDDGGDYVCGDYVCGDYAPLNIAGCLGTQRALHQ